jgi:hypothetical protein
VLVALWARQMQRDWILYRVEVIFGFRWRWCSLTAGTVLLAVPLGAGSDSGAGATSPAAGVCLVMVNQVAQELDALAFLMVLWCW